MFPHYRSLVSDSRSTPGLLPPLTITALLGHTPQASLYNMSNLVSRPANYTNRAPPPSPQARDLCKKTRGREVGHPAGGEHASATEESFTRTFIGSMLYASLLALQSIRVHLFRSTHHSKRCQHSVFPTMNARLSRTGTRRCCASKSTALHVQVQVAFCYLWNLRHQRPAQFTLPGHGGEQAIPPSLIALPGAHREHPSNPFWFCTSKWLALYFFFFL